MSFTKETSWFPRGNSTGSVRRTIAQMVGLPENAENTPEPFKIRHLTIAQMVGLADMETNTPEPWIPRRLTIAQMAGLAPVDPNVDTAPILELRAANANPKASPLEFSFWRQRRQATGTPDWRTLRKQKLRSANNAFAPEAETPATGVTDPQSPTLLQIIGNADTVTPVVANAPAAAETPAASQITIMEKIETDSESRIEAKSADLSVENFNNTG